jgi:hypothetical protein
VQPLTSNVSEVPHSVTENVGIGGRKRISSLDTDRTHKLEMAGEGFIGVATWELRDCM